MSTTTQTCKKCPKKGPQPLSNFHRKGNGYHKTCKNCRNDEIREYGRQRSAGTLIRRKTSPIRSENFVAMQERIATLESRLRAKAVSFAHDGMDADDIYSVMVEAVLTKSKPEDETFFILQCASWAAKQYISKNLTYSRYVDDIDVDEQEVEKSGFKIVTNPRAIEDALIQNENMAELKVLIEQLPEENRKVVAMLSVGMNKQQIASELKVSKKRIEEQVQSIRATLSFSFA